MPKLHTVRHKVSRPKAHFAVFSQAADSYNLGYLMSKQGWDREHNLFLGKYARTLDDRSRITVPNAFRTELAGGAYMTQGFDRNLQVLTANAFEELYRQATALNAADPLARMLLRLFLGNAIELRRVRVNIAIPDNLREFAGLRENVLLIGQGDYFEIWAPDQWSQQEAELMNAEANASRFAGLTLGSQGTRHN